MSVCFTRSVAKMVCASLSTIPYRATEYNSRTVSYTIYVVLAYLKDMFDIRLSYMHTEHICVHIESDLVAAVLFLVSSALVQSAARPKSAGYTQNETRWPIEQDTSMLHMKGMILCVWHTKIMHCK